MTQQFMQRGMMRRRYSADIQALREATNGLDKSSSQPMLVANLQYLWDRYVENPGDNIPKHLKREDKNAENRNG